MTTYYPSAKIRLAIRLEEFGSKLVDRAPKKAAKNLRGTAIDRTNLKATEEDAPGGGKVWRIVGPNSGARPTQPEKSALANTYAVRGILPVSASLKRNGVRLADTLGFQLLARDFPIDPRLVRSCAVEFFLGVVSAEEFAAGQNGDRRSNGEPLDLIADETTWSDGVTRSNLRFQGWADKVTASYTVDALSVVNFECTDNTRLLLGQPAPPNLRMDPKLPIEQMIAEYLAHFPAFEGFAVRYLPQVAQGSVRVEKAMLHSAWPPHLGPPPSGGGGAAGGGAGALSALDYVFQVANAVGHSVRIVGAEIMIQPSNTIWGGRRAKRYGDSYTKRTTPEGVNLPHRTLVHGWNADLEFSRAFAGTEAKNVEVRSYNSARKQMTVGRYPEKGEKVIAALPGGKEDDKWQVIAIRPNVSAEMCKEIAQQAYEARARTELAVVAKTKHLGSLGADGMSPDLLDLEAGDPIDMLRDMSEAEASTFAAEERAFTAASTGAEYLVSLGYDQEFAAAYAAARTHVGMQRTFYTREAAFNFAAEDQGLDITVSATNYIEVRLDPDKKP